MVLTNAQNVAFYTSPEQMGIPAATYAQLQQEGMSTVDDLEDFEADCVKRIADSLRRPSGRIPDPRAGAVDGPPAGTTMPTPPFQFGMKSQIRLEAAINLVYFYKTIGRDITAQNVVYEPIIKNFKELWEALNKRKKGDAPEVPKLSKGTPMIKWVESFDDHLCQCIGMRMVPLAYVIRDKAEVPALCPALAAGQPYSNQFGSIEDDMINRASHLHGLFKDDNASVYYKLEEATRNTVYSDSILPFQRSKDGRGAMKALIGQYAGEDKWQAEINKQTDIIQTRVWKGQSNFPLEKFCQLHRSAYIALVAAAQHVDYQLPTGHTRVTNLLKKIECEDSRLQAAIANVEDDKATDGKRHDFEKTVAYILPADPVRRRMDSAPTTGGKRSNASISDVNVETSGLKVKSGIGNSGVHLRYHDNSEYATLSNDQKNELREWRANTKDKGGSARRGESKGKKKQKRAKAFAVAVEKAVSKMAEGQTPPAAATANGTNVSATETLARNLLNSIVQSKSGGNVSATQVAKVTPASEESSTAQPLADNDEPLPERRVAFNGILKRAANRS